MIVAFTNYDPASSLLEGFARELISLAGSRVSLILGPPADSVASNIQSSLASVTAPFFFFGHGKSAPPAMVGQDQANAIDSSTHSLLADRLVYGACCYSVDILAPAASTHNTTVLGYKGKLMLPLLPVYEPLMRGCALAGAESLLRGKTVQDAHCDMQTEYDNVARRLIGGSIQDQVVAVRVFDKNARATTFAGDPLLRL